MPPGLSFPAPSQALLRYLRAQSRGLAISSTAHPGGGTGCSQQNGPRRHLSYAPRAKRRQICSQDRVAKPGSPSVLRPELLSRSGSACRAITTSCLRQESQNNTADDCGKKKWWGRTLRRVPQPQIAQEDEDVSPHEEAAIFPRRSSAAKAALDPRLRCTEVDENGNVIMVDGEFKKSELIAKYGLLPRDLRKIDSSSLPHILIRRTAILLNLLHLKVLIKHDRVLLFDVFGSKSSYPQSAFMHDLQGKLQQKQDTSLPYEFRALEAVLTSVTSELEADFATVRDPVLRILSELEDDIDRDKLRVLLVLSKKLSTFEQKARLVRDAIEELLEANDDLAAMYLSEKYQDVHRGADDHTEVEMLLESYHKICDEVVQEAGNLVSSIRNTEEIIRAILDANRNSLMLLDLKFSVGTLGLATGTFMAGLYGMNLENFIENTNWGFGAVTGLSTVASIIICMYGLAKLRKVQRVKMNGDGVSFGQSNHNDWFRDDSTGVLLDPGNRERLRKMRMLHHAAKPKKWYLRG